MKCFRKKGGFTVVEIMIVVVIIGLLAAIAIPTFNSIRLSAQTSRMVNDYRTFRTAFEVHAFELGYWPDDVARGVIPNTVADYMKGDAFSQATPIGGNWDWDFDHGQFWAGVSVVDPTAGTTVMEKIDGQLEDGNLSTGDFRETASNRFTLILEHL